MSRSNRDRLRFMCLQRVIGGRSLSEIARSVHITPKAVSKALNSPQGKKERERLAERYEEMMMILRISQITERLEALQP